METLQLKLKEGRMDFILSRYQVFVKAKEQAYFLYQDLDLGELIYFKVIVDDQFVKKIDAIDGNGMVEHCEDMDITTLTHNLMEAINLK